MLHDVELDVDPLQGFPPEVGAGLVQDRDRDLVPPPHVFEQLPQEPHEVKPP